MAGIDPQVDPRGAKWETLSSLQATRVLQVLYLATPVHNAVDLVDG